MRKLHQIVLLTILIASTSCNGYLPFRRKSVKSARKIETSPQLLMMFPGEIAINRSQTNEEIFPFPNKIIWNNSAYFDRIRPQRKKQRSHKMETSAAVLKFPGDGQSRTNDKYFQSGEIRKISPKLKRLNLHKVRTNRTHVKLTQVSLSSEENKEGDSLNNTTEREGMYVETVTTTTSSSEIFKPNTFEECIKAGYQFCEDPSVLTDSNEFIENGLKKPENKMLMEFLRNANENEDNRIENRIGAQPHGFEIKLCETRKSLTYPTHARNSDGDYSAIINNANYRQPVYIEICTSIEVNAIRAPKNHKFLCLQGYQTYQLLGPLSSDLNTFNLKTFDVPSHCTIKLLRIN